MEIALNGAPGGFDALLGQDTLELSNTPSAMPTTRELLQYLEPPKKLDFLTHETPTPSRSYATIMVAFRGQYSTQDIAGE
jgi:hypothetical protein